MNNPFSAILNDLNLTETTSGDLAYVYLICRSLEGNTDAVNGYTGDRKPCRYMVEYLQSQYGDTVAVRRIRAMFAQYGKLD